MRRKILSILFILLGLLLTLAGCNAGDPLGDDFYSTASYIRLAEDGGGGYWHEYNLGAIDLSPGASGATQITPNVSSLGGYRFDDITEHLYFTTHVEDDWDGISDGVLEVSFEVNVDNTAGLVTDTVEIAAECWHKLPGEFGNVVNSHEGSTVVGQSDQHELFIQNIVIDDIRVNEVIAFRINLNTIFSEVDSIIINYVEFKYRTYIPAQEES